MVSDEQHPDWIVRGKTIRELIRDLQSFEDQDMQVEISLDSGASSKPVSLVGKERNLCIIMNCER